MLTRSLLARINALKSADTIKDIVVQKQFRFHALVNKKGKNLESLEDKADYIKEQYFLEVSSAGIEKVLKYDKHFEKNFANENDSY